MIPFWETYYEGQPDSPNTGRSQCWKRLPFELSSSCACGRKIFNFPDITWALNISAYTLDLLQFSVVNNTAIFWFCNSQKRKELFDMRFTNEQIIN